MSNGFGWSWNRTLNGLFEFGFIWCDTIHAREGKFCPLLEVWDTGCDKLFLKVDGDARTETFYHADGTTEFFQLDAHVAVQKCMWFQATTQNILLEYRLLDNVMNFTDNGIIRSSGGSLPSASGDVLTWTGGVYPVGQMEWQTPTATIPTHIIGEIFLWSSNVLPVAPAGQEYLLCDGATIVKANYTALDAIYSASTPAYPFGSTPTNMNIPNLINRLPKQQGTIGTTGGSDSVTLTNAELPSHKHDINSDGSSGGLATMLNNGAHIHEVIYDSGGVRRTPILNLPSAPLSGASVNTSVLPGFYAMNIGDDPRTNLEGNHNHLMGGSTQLDGGGGAINITNAYLSLNYVIRVK